MHSRIVLLAFIFHFQLYGFSIIPESGNDSALNQKIYACRYGFAQSAMQPPKGTAIYQVTDFLMYDIQTGITDKFSMGLEFQIPFAGYLNTKYQIKSNSNLKYAAGNLFISAFYVNDFKKMRGTMPYLSVTKGDVNHHGTLGAGFLYQNISREKGVPVINVSGLHKLSSRLEIMFECWMASALQTQNYTQSIWDRDMNGNVKWNYIYLNGNAVKKAVVTTKDMSYSFFTQFLIGNLMFRIGRKNHAASRYTLGLTAFYQHSKQISVKQEYSTYDPNANPNFKSEYQTFGNPNRFIFLPLFNFTGLIY